MAAARAAGMACSRIGFTWRGNEIFSPVWPAASTGAEAVALAAVFAAAVLIEWSHHRAVVSVAAHAGRVCGGYALMLAAMSFDVGVLAAAMSGHAMGFLTLGCRSSSRQRPPTGWASPPSSLLPCSSSGATTAPWRRWRRTPAASA
ncbi:copper transporter 3-like [Zingiber officinale]|uniref:copper transporter 3-like n=1 Tax=Zingiber officinale TaxID=94328 RepID=UPI001C4ABFBC|nr:copper transporter 3-like [Zingiber officinale]